MVIPIAPAVRIYDRSFTKSGGTIYGYNAENPLWNKAKDDSEIIANEGHAAYVGYTQRRETTAGPDVNLDSSVSGATGGWED